LHFITRQPGDFRFFVEYFSHSFVSVVHPPNKTPEPTAVGAVRSAIAVHVASRRWLSLVC
jgi:hypothetical protein